MVDQNDEYQDQVNAIPVAPQGGNTKLWYERLTAKQKTMYEKEKAKALNQLSRANSASAKDFHSAAD